MKGLGNPKQRRLRARYRQKIYDMRVRDMAPDE